MKRMKRIAAVLLVFALLPFAYADAESKLEGVIRVLLTKLNITDTVKLSLDGSYTLNGISFQRGSDITVSSKTGSLMVYYEGMALDAGKTMTFKRHPVPLGQENGIRIGNQYELHPGDLVISVKSGMLRLVLHTPVEEYLLGVVPYEMSNSFPLEALKAQAVTARTYALRKSGASGDYDVVDNTNDQAYMGVKAENARAAQAIMETKGMCGVYKGKLAECYYSASNGGQTELVHHVWGGGDYDYLRMYDDPYDLENPESVVMRATLPKTVNTPQELMGLKDILYAEIHEPLASQGFETELGYTIRAIEKMEMISPKYADSPSRIMTQLSVTVGVDGMKFGREDEEVSMTILENEQAAMQQQETVKTLLPAKATVTVALPVFSLVEDALNLSINQTDNEIITLQETESAYIFESRRYGHGVGMSQRGAQWMAAQYQWTCEQILNFYYPGMSLKTYQYTYQMPEAIKNEFLATPGPAATPTPRPTAMPLKTTPAPNEKMVTVTNIGVNSYLNLRAQNSTTSDVLRQLYYGQQLIVVEDLGEWLKVRMDDMEGYVMREYVHDVQEKPQ